MTLAGEIADLLHPALRVVVRMRSQIVVGVGVVITLLCAFALVGAALDDAAIDRNPAVAQADVLDGSTFFRTLVRFTAASGEVVVPEAGVAYPRGLVVGSSVAVEYDVTDPDRVRVAGRTALTSAWPLVIAVVVTWAVLGPLAVRLRRRPVSASPVQPG